MKSHFFLCKNLGTLLCFLFFLQLFFPFSGIALPIGETKARKLAESFFKAKVSTRSFSQDNKNISLQLVSAPVRKDLLSLKDLSSEKTCYYYIYNRGDQEGFVIVSGDDQLSPYIGYAMEGTFSSKNMPAHLTAFLEACQRTIEHLSKDLSYTLRLEPTKPTATEKKKVLPILNDIHWNQDFPWYDKTPKEGGVHTPVGCVATAYTQIMRYYKWPEKGVGSFSYKENNKSKREHSVNFGITTYDWKNMPAGFPRGKNPTTDEIEALSTLAYHAGVAVEMMYESGGSGTYSPLVVRALREHFKYDKGVTLISRHNYTQTTWEATIRKELEESRPVMYSGSGTGGGHAFVCDGYNEEGLFHINWGWGGQSDGYFNLNYLDPDALGIGGGAGGGFSSNQSAVIGIKPDRDGTSQKPADNSFLFADKLHIVLKGGQKLIVSDATAWIYCIETYEQFNGEVGLGVAKVGSQDTVYLSYDFTRDMQINTMTGKKYSIFYKSIPAGTLSDGIWDFFIAQRNRSFYGQPAQRWRPCTGGQHHAFQIKKEGNEYKVEDYDKKYSWYKLQLKENSCSTKFEQYSKSSIKFTLQNKGKKEFFENITLQLKRTTEKEWHSFSSNKVAIDAGKEYPVEISISRFPYKVDKVDVRLLYKNEKGDTTYLALPPQAVTSPSKVNPCISIAPVNKNQQVTLDLLDGSLSQAIRISYLGTNNPPQGVILYRYRFNSSKGITATKFKLFDLSKGKIQEEKPALKDITWELPYTLGEKVIMSAEFYLVNEDGTKILGKFPIVETPNIPLFLTKKDKVKNGTIKMTTSRKAGEQVTIQIVASGGVEIDGVEEKVAILGRNPGVYTLKGSEITIRGEVQWLKCSDNNLTSLDVSKTKMQSLFCGGNELQSLDLSSNRELQEVDCSNNRLSYLKVCNTGDLYGINCSANRLRGSDMTNFINSLSSRRVSSTKMLYIVTNPGEAEGNLCLKSDASLARSKDWFVVRTNRDPYYGEEGGARIQTYEVILKQPEKGKIEIDGTHNLKAITEGTELTIKCTPNEGYELDKYLVNGQETNSNKVVIRTNTTISAKLKEKTFKITLKQPAEGGTIAIKDYDEKKLQAVTYGTVLTIIESPSTGYELETLTANNIDIKASKSFVVRGTTTITATFKMVKKPTPPTPEPKKKTFAVTIEKAENGTIEVVEKVDLKAVEEGTTLTLKATPTKGYELETLTANGKDIKKVMKVEIKEATTLKATFKKSTAIETVDGATIHLYPNPATNFVRVEGTLPHTAIMLYTMEGRRLLSAQSNAEGSLTLDLSAYNEGVYLLLLDGNSYRLVIRR